MRKKVNGKGTPESGRLQMVDSAVLIKTIYRFFIPGSATQERRCNEIVRTDKKLDQLTGALNYKG